LFDEVEELRMQVTMFAELEESTFIHPFLAV
jgi:hypothetical protein